MKLFRIIASGFYSVGVFIRNMLYHNGLLRIKEVDIPTICVGNLAVGGTGKTPHVEYLIRLLQDKYKVAVLSRGYKRKTTGVVIADKQSTAHTIGDEPMQIHMKFPDVPICVSANRLKGVAALQEKYPDLDVIILDDAYQHRAIKCGYYVLLTAENNLYVDDHLLPWGRLREHIYRSHQAETVVVTKCPEKMRPIDKRSVDNALKLAPYQTLCFSWLRYGALRQMVALGAKKPKQQNHEREQAWFFRPLVLTGIAHPEPMLEEVKSKYPQAQLLAFSDHHDFTQADIRKIAKTYEQYNCDAIITTEKDAVRLQLHKEYMANWGSKTFILPIEVDLKEFTEIFNQKILQYVTKNTRNR